MNIYRFLKFMASRFRSTVIKLLVILILVSTGLVTSANASVEGTWKLAPEAGALGVGPSRGDTGWWSSSAADVEGRACLFDDTYTFDADGSFIQSMGDATWLEGWQSAAEGCGAPVAPHDGSNAATYAYDAAAGTLTVSGDGAHIGLPKVTNQGEIFDVENIPNSRTYLVTELTDTSMTLNIDFGSGWWRFKLVPADYISPPPVTAFVTFQVNMDGVDTSNGVSVMGGAIFGQAGLDMSDDDGDNVWTVTAELDANTTVMFKYRNTTALTWDGQESVAADCAHGEWGDRQVVVGEEDITLDVVGWGLCADVTDPSVAVFHDAFGGLEVEGDTFIFPSYAEPWAAVANSNTGLYPISLENGGTLTFSGSAYADVDVRFRLEYQTYPENNPAYDTATVTVTEGSADYSIDLDAQGSNTFSSFLLYVVDRDIPVTISNVKVTAGLEVHGCTDAAADNYNPDATVDDGSCTYPATTVSVTFQVDMTAVDTNADGVYLAGGGVFGQDGVLMTDNGSDVWTATVDFDMNTQVLYKFRNQPSYGTWDGFEDAAGLVAGGCNAGPYDDRFVDVGESDIVLDITPYGECYYEQSISVSNSPKGILGKPVVFEVSYDTNNNQLTGLGFRVHFDSSILSYSQITNLIEQDIIVSGQGPFNDEDDFDNDPLTDQYILFGWASLYNNWPNVELPAVLMNIAFDVLTGINTDEVATTSINFTETALAADRQFGANNYELELVALTWDFDGNGVADALTDGLMMLRYHFGLRGEYVTENAMALDSPLSSEEVIAEMEAAFEIADIDDDGEIEALTDSLMLLRYLFGLRGDELTAGAVSNKANRSSNEAIEAYIEAYMP